MKQSRASSFRESLANVIIGLLVSWMLTFWVLPWWGLEPSVGQAIEISVLFTLASVARSYTLRRAFNALGVGA